MKVAIPRWGDSVAPCVGHCALMSVYTVSDGRVTERVDFPLRSRDPFDRIRLLRDQEVGTIICGGVQDRLEEVLRVNGIRVISWVAGPVDELLRTYLSGELAPEQRRTPVPRPDTPSHRLR